MTHDTRAINRPTSTDRTRHPWWGAVAAAVAVATVVAGPVLAQTTAPPKTVVTPPVTASSAGSPEIPLLPAGVPSTTSPSELVVSITLFRQGAYRLYADGRLVWFDQARFDDTPVPLRSGFGWAEQRLTPDGVERVRSAFLASGMFDAVQPSDDFAPCTRGLQVCVRDGDRWLVVDADVPPFAKVPYGNTPPKAVALVSFLRTLDSTLLPTDWVDQRVSAYVPARIGACFRMFARRVETLFDRSELLLRLPQPVTKILAERGPSAELATFLTPLRGNAPENSCFELPLDEARTLADVFLSVIGGGVHEYEGIVIRFGRRPDPLQSGATRPEAAYLRFESLLPEGVPSSFFGG